MDLVRSFLAHQWPWYWLVQRRTFFGQGRLRTRQKKKLHGAPACWGTQSAPEAQLECLVPFRERPLHGTDTTELLSAMRRAAAVQINSQPFWRQAAETLLALCPALGTGEAIDALLSFSRANYAEGTITDVLLRRIRENTNIASLDASKLLRLLSARGVQGFPDRSFITAVYDALVKQFHTLDEHQVALSLRCLYQSHFYHAPFVTAFVGRFVNRFAHFEDAHIRWCAIAAQSVPIDDATFLKTLCNEVHRRLDSLEISDVIVLTKALGATRKAPSRLTESLFSFLCRKFPDIPLLERPLLCEALTIAEPIFECHSTEGPSQRSSKSRAEVNVAAASASIQKQESGAHQELVFPSGYAPGGGGGSWEPSWHGGGRFSNARFESKNEYSSQVAEGQSTSFKTKPCSLFVYRCVKTVLKLPRLFSAQAVFQVYTRCRRLELPLCEMDLKRLRSLLNEKLGTTADLEEKFSVLSLAENHEEFTLLLKAFAPFDMDPASITEAAVEIFIRFFFCALRLKHTEAIVACFYALRPFILDLELQIVDVSSESQRALLGRKALLVVSSALNQEALDTSDGSDGSADQVAQPLPNYVTLDRLGLRKSDLRLARQIFDTLENMPTESLALCCLYNGHVAGSRSWFEELLRRLSSGKHASSPTSEWVPSLVFSISRSLTENAVQELPSTLPSSFFGHAHQASAAALDWVVALCMHGFPAVSVWKAKENQKSSYPAAALSSLTLATLLQGLFNCTQAFGNGLRALDGAVPQTSAEAVHSEDERVETVHTVELDCSPESVLASTAAIATDLLLSRFDAHSLTASMAKELALRKKRYRLHSAPVDKVEAWQLVRAVQCAVAFRLPRDPLLLDCVCLCAKSLVRAEELLVLLRVVAKIGSLSFQSLEALSAAVDRRQGALLKSPVLSQRVEHYCEVLGLSSIDLTSLELLPPSPGDIVIGSEGVPETYSREAAARHKNTEPSRT